MPIPVVCANCQTRLNAPDAAAGRKVKCPKCQTVMPVPGAELPPPLPPPPATGDTPFDFGGGSPPPPPPRRSAPPPEPAPPAAGGAAFDFGAAVSSGGGGRERGEREDRPRRRRDEDDAPPAGDRPRRPRPADDDSAEDDRPRGRRRPEGGGKKFPMMLVLLGLGAVLMLCCVAPVGVYFLAVAPKLKEAIEKAQAEIEAKQKQIDDEKKRQAGGGPGGGGGITAGWTKFEAPDKSVRASFPQAFVDDGGLAFQTPTTLGAKSYQTQESDGSLICTLAVVKFRPTSKAADREKDLKTAAGLMSLAAKDLGTPQTLDWLGGRAKETVGKSAFAADVTIVTRSVVVGNTGYVAMVQHKNKPDVAPAFFASVEPLSK